MDCCSKFPKPIRRRRPSRWKNSSSPETKNLDIYLAIPDYRQRGLNVSTGKDGGTRYLAEVTAFRDENTGTSEKPIQVARKNMRLLADSENREGSSVLRIANVERTPAGTFQLNPRFIPPLIEIGASEYLVGLLRGLVELLSARSTQLSAGRRQKNQSLADFTASDIANFWLLYTVNSNFPVFSHLYESKMGHPEELYAAMVTLAGSLTTFSQKMRPRDLPLYVHDSLGPIFSELDEKLRSLLETVVPTNLVSLPLKLIAELDLCHGDRPRQVSGEHAHVPGGERGNQRRNHHSESAATGESLFSDAH